MPIVYPTDEIMLEVLEREGASDLLFTLTEASVALPQQWRLVSLGYSNLKKFSGIEDTRALVRAAMVLDLELDPTLVGLPGQEARLALSSLVIAWESAKERLGKETQLRTEAKVLGVPRQVDIVDRTAMKKAVELVQGKMPLHETPSADYIAQKMGELEDNELVASPLDEISSLTDLDLSSTVNGHDSAGRSQMFRKRNKGSLPLTPEAFRTRLRVEKNAWLMLATKFLNRGYLVGMNAASWEQWTDYFLGSKVMLLETVQADGSRKPINPPWQIILSYELECRKNALFRVQEDGLSFVAAMSLVLKDPELKELAFTSPIAHLARGRGIPEKALPLPKARPSPYQGAGKRQGQKGQSKGKGKGKGKNKGLAKGTPDGRQICFKYNSPTGCTDPCPDRRIHACRTRGCYGTHPVMDCPTATAAQ